MIHGKIDEIANGSMQNTAHTHKFLLQATTLDPTDRQKE